MATMKSSVYSILLCLLCFVAAGSAFSPHPVRFSVGRTILALSDESASSQASEESKPPVKVACPDCDLCDGSGRYVYSRLFRITEALQSIMELA
jgi:hypothetical protein